MKKYEQKEVTEVKEILVGLTCDICGEKIDINKGYYKATIGHNDWGNDSIESIEKKDICSDECLKKEFEQYIAADGETKYIEIEKTTTLY
jgi:hypothetical protein